MPKNHNNSLRWYTVELAVLGVNESKDPSAQHDFDFELSMRPHIIKKVVSWDRAEHQITIQLVTEGIDPKTTGDMMAEELFEVAAGVLNAVEGMHVIVLKVAEINS